jgi:hypothetical protein
LGCITCVAEVAVRVWIEYIGRWGPSHERAEAQSSGCVTFQGVIPSRPTLVPDGSLVRFRKALMCSVRFPSVLLHRGAPCEDSFPTRFDVWLRLRLAPALGCMRPGRRHRPVVVPVGSGNRLPPRLCGSVGDRQYSTIALADDLDGPSLGEQGDEMYDGLCAQTYDHARGVASPRRVRLATRRPGGRDVRLLLHRFHRYRCRQGFIGSSCRAATNSLAGGRRHTRQSRTQELRGVL